MLSNRRSAAMVHGRRRAVPTRFFLLAAALWTGLLAAALPAAAQLLPENPVTLAIREDNVEALEQAFLEGYTANERSLRGRPALTEAVALGRTGMVRILLDRGARVNTRDRDGETALSEAARTNQPDIARMLIAAGADVDKPGAGGDTPLMIAARLGHAGVVAALIEGGAYLNETDRTGRTPLMLAEERRHRQVAQLLREAGAE